MLYDFQKTPYGTIQVMQKGKQIALTTPDLASMQYGYQAGPASPKRNEGIPLGGGFDTPPRVTPYDPNSTGVQPPVNNNTISGSASVINGMNTTRAMTGAGNSVQTPPITSPQAPPGSPQNVTAGAPIGTFTPTPSGNSVSYTDPTTGKILASVPTGASLTPQFQQSLSFASSANQSLKPGYTTAVQSDGSIQFKDTTGNTVGTVTPTGNAGVDQRAVDQMTGQMGAYDSTVTAIKSESDAQNKEIDTQLNTQITQIEDQRKAALGAARSTFGQPDAATSTADTSYTIAINDKFDKLAQQARADAESAKAKISSGTQTAIASAGANLSSTFADISQKAQTEATTEFEFTKTQEQGAAQYAGTQAMNMLTKLNLDPTVTQGLTIGANGLTGNDQADAVIASFVKSGKTPEQALGLVQGSSLAAQKQTQNDWINLMKNTPIQIPEGTTLQKAQQDPYLAEMIRQGTQVFGSPEAAFGFLSQTSTAGAKLLEIQAQTSKAQIDALLAPDKLRQAQGSGTLTNVRDTVTRLVSPSQPTGQFLSTIKWFTDAQTNREQMASGNAGATLGFIDAVVKAWNGGQAMRQGQQNLINEGATYPQKIASLVSSLGLNIGPFTSDPSGTVLVQPDQADGIMRALKATVKANAGTIATTFTDLQKHTDEAKLMYPEKANDIDIALEPIQPAIDYINGLGTTDTSSGGGISSTSSYSSMNNQDFYNSF